MDFDLFSEMALEAPEE